VTDTTGPTFTICAPNQATTANSNGQAIIPDFTAFAAAVDCGSSTVTFSQSPLAGGLTFSGASSVPVTITASDVTGNTSSCVATLAVVRTGSYQLPYDFVQIQPGSFQMGEVGIAEPVHAVTISYTFLMGAKEVAQADYTALAGTNPSYFNAPFYPNSDNRPVERVSWSNARSYCAALTSQQAALGAVPAGYEYRLPTEAEWEYACRAGTTTSWNVGNSLSCSSANFYGCVGQTSDVGSYAPNAWGLYDMHGNVWEWCLDSYSGYPSGAVADPFVSGGPDRIMRGGGWGINPADCRSSHRLQNPPSIAGYSLGFRVVLGPILVP
jgi:formylglycine-generating enzyme required for sulfatase activity